MPGYHTYLINYTYDGVTYSFDVYASSWKEAEERLEAIKETGEVEGRLEKYYRVEKYYNE